MCRPARGRSGDGLGARWGRGDSGAGLQSLQQPRGNRHLVQAHHEADPGGPDLHPAGGLAYTTVWPIGWDIPALCTALQVGNTHKLTIAGLTSWDYGPYYCKAANLLDKQTSQPVQLTGKICLPLED